jgi:hypothetical protein
MTLEYVKNVASKYKELLILRYDVMPQLKGEMPSKIKHLCEMADKMQDMDDMEKACRWLGFMQGVLWTEDVFTIDDLREHNTGGK